MSIDVKLINAFLESLLHVLYTMAQTDAGHKTPSLKTDLIAKGEVSGFITMSNTDVTGSIAVSFCEDTILAIAKRMLGVELSSIDETIEDLVSEITNMVSGEARQILVDSDHVFDITSPEVITGKEHELAHKNPKKIILVPFQSSSGSFYAEFSFQNRP